MNDDRPSTLTRVALERVPYDPTAPHEAQVLLRMPRELRWRLREEAARLGTSLQQLCLSRLTAAVVDCPLLPRRPHAPEQLEAWRVDMDDGDHDRGAETGETAMPLSAA